MVIRDGSSDVCSSDLMSIRIVRLGSPRAAGEGLRIGTVRRPPRGVPKADFARRDFYDVWLPILSPSPELVTQALAAAPDAEWNKVARKIRSELPGGEAGKEIGSAECRARVCQYGWT